MDPETIDLLGIIRNNGHFHYSVQLTVEAESSDSDAPRTRDLDTREDGFSSAGTGEVSYEESGDSHVKAPEYKEEYASRRIFKQGYMHSLMNNQNLVEQLGRIFGAVDDRSSYTFSADDTPTERQNKVNLRKAVIQFLSTQFENSPDLRRDMEALRLIGSTYFGAAANPLVDIFNELVSNIPFDELPENKSTVPVFDENGYADKDGTELSLRNLSVSNLLRMVNYDNVKDALTASANKLLADPMMFIGGPGGGADNGEASMSAGDRLLTATTLVGVGRGLSLGKSMIQAAIPGADDISMFRSLSAKEAALKAGGNLDDLAKLDSKATKAIANARKAKETADYAAKAKKAKDLVAASSKARTQITSASRLTGWKGWWSKVGSFFTGGARSGTGAVAGWGLRGVSGGARALSIFKFAFGATPWGIAFNVATMVLPMVLPSIVEEFRETQQEIATVGIENTSGIGGSIACFLHSCTGLFSV